MRHVIVGLLAGVGLLAATSTEAAVYLGSATLKGDQEVAGSGSGPFTPAPTGSDGVGAAFFLYNSDTNIISDLNISVNGLTTAELNTTGLPMPDMPTGNGFMHIHNGAAGTNGPVYVQIGGNPNTVFQSLADGFTAFLAETPAISEQNEAALLAGNSYLNVHSKTFPGGEIRGQISLALVPVPAALPLLASALVGIGFLARRRSHSA